MIRENSSRSSFHRSSSSRLPLVALLTATGLASILACSSDDDGDDANTNTSVDTDTDVLPLDSVDPVDVEDREFPPPAPGSDTPNGLSLPEGMADWGVIGVVNVTSDPPTVRVVIGNAAAVDAARSGQTNPWPDGAMIGHLQWQPGSEPASGTAVTPGAFARATLMVKDSDEYAADGGWAYGVWNGTNLVPPGVPEGDAAPFDRACVDCHTSRVADRDYVFTIPGALPDQDAIDAAPQTPNGLTLPAGILDWRVIGVASREADDSPTIRVIVGNDIAVEAARAGNVDPWPDGSMLAHYNWVAGENPVAPNTVNPVSFAAFTLMVKDSEQYAADGGWAYGAWSGPELGVPDDGFDRDCVECHTTRVSDTDFVFTRPGELPDAFISP